MPKFEILRKIVYSLSLIVLLSLILMECRDFLYPIALAILFAYLLYPVGHFLETKGIPRILANVLCILLLVVVVGGVLYFISHQVGKLTSNWEEMKQQAMDNIDSMEERLGRPLAEMIAPGPGHLSDVLLDSLEAGGNTLKTLFTATTGTVTKMALMPIYIFMLLYYRTKLYEFMLEIMPDRYSDRTKNIVLKVSYVMRNYIGGVFVVVLILSIVNSAGLAIIGLKYAIFFGVVSAIMNFIPYFGTLLGGGIALLAALLLNSDPGVALWTLLFFIVIQFVENNILTPNITGGYVQINPLFTILGIVLGGLAWGIPGMFLVVPFLAVIKIICDHTAMLRPVGKLIGKGGTGEHELTIKKVNRFFHRSKH
ncbi:AI-2E family transporter [Roseivirga sp. BDSF3-8]|uniref:AI-2E family transporter n=1 Tax=Roseivirga sp. BDSF3-8 TaxID=3241598 RepID=UPI0035326D4B